jgi:PAS domain S-box-containing protein
MLTDNVKDYANYRLDPEGRVASWNNAAARLEGYAENEIVGRDFSIFFTPDDIAAGEPARLLRLTESQELCDYEGWQVRKDGSRFWCEVVCTAVRDESGRLMGFYKVTHDVTERKRGEEKLKAHICQLAVVADLGQEALVADDLEGFMEKAVSLVTQTCAVEFGLVLELLPEPSGFLLRSGIGWQPGYVGKAIVPATPDTHSGFALREEKPVIFEDLMDEQRFAGAPILHQHGVRSGVNVIVRRGEGVYGILGIYSTMKRSFTTDDIHFVQAVANIMSAVYERHRARGQLEKFNEELERQVERRTEQLQEANKELESFSYSVSHDLRTPLRHIGGFIEMLHRATEGKLEKNAQSMVQVIAESAQKMDDLISDLLTFSRMGCSEMRQVRISMTDVINKARNELAGETQNRRITWTIAPMPEVSADMALLRQVWVNLIGNALKYSRTRDETAIEIGSRPEGEEWVFWIRDNGVGFDPNYAHKLFGVFQRLHPARDFEGTGIGLAIVRRIVARHGGRTWAESAAGQGATFYFSLPKDGISYQI